jgi:aryl-alcohol dehydrogenase-like predicted oxidoreductase
VAGAGGVMERRRLGRTGLMVSVLGFGGSEIGFERTDVGTVRRMLDEALDAGLNVIDTAECYGDSEALIGAAVGGRRRDYHLFTKCGHYEGSGRDDWRPASLERSIARSLERLRTDHVDLLQLHSCPEDELRRGDVIDVLERARQRGQARFIGCSGDNAAVRYAVSTGRFDVLQTSINVADHEALSLTLPAARAADLGVIAKRPIANAAWRTGARPANAYHHVYWERLQQLRYDFLARPVPEAIGVALRFTASVPGVHTLIVGTTKPGRWRENAALMAAGALPAAELAAIHARWHAVADASWTGQR